MQEESALTNFKYALRKYDQQILDELMVYARLHLSAAAQSGYFLPAFMFIISMLLEILKQIKMLQADVESLKAANEHKSDRLDS